MVSQLPIHTLGLDYVRKFTEAYKSTDDPYLREQRCERTQFPAVLMNPQNGDWLIGRRLYPEVGYSVQYGGMGYYLNERAFDVAAHADREDKSKRAEWRSLRSFWQSENTMGRCVDEFPALVNDHIPNLDIDYSDFKSPAYYLLRMAGLQLNYELLVREGLSGLLELISRSKKACPDTGHLAFYDTAAVAVETLMRSLEHFSIKLRSSKSPSPESIAMLSAVEGLLQHPPSNFHEGLQLVMLVSSMTSTLNFGRLDIALGPLLCRDLDEGELQWEHALSLMKNFYSIIENQICHWDGRIIVGGLGREDEVSADRFAMLAMETTMRLNLPMPQLTLRFYEGQNPKLLDMAYKVIKAGKTFPLLYNDDINVKAVEYAFKVDRTTAEQYIPFGCGEYIVDHQSCGTPNAIINLQRCLESAINHGQCLKSGEQIGPDYGGLEHYPDFDSLWDAYTRTVEYHVDALATAQASIYKSVGSRCPFSLISLLYDDCMLQGRPIFNGGVKYLGGTNETYGNINTSDSLNVIKQLVFDRQEISGASLLASLASDWKNDPSLLECVNQVEMYGNDDDLADEMAARVHDHICRYNASMAERVGLHHFLVVIINNNTNTAWGKGTSASADGRKHGAPLAPGNAAGAGRDRSGVTAVLNSQVKLDPMVHAGAVQNVKLSAELAQNSPELYRALFDVYFARGGTQAMISITRREDLLAALEKPQEYGHLLVRVGGFSARFVDLDPSTQEEILSRTEHVA